MHQQRSALMSRPELSHLQATQSGRVFVIHPRLCAGPMQVIGGCYYAKWLHPSLFQDLDPAAVHKQMMDTFWHQTVSGVWGVPVP